MLSYKYENYQEIKSHGDPLFPYNTYPCTIPFDFIDVPLHWHNEMELIYVKKGKGTVTLDVQAHHIEGGDIIIVIPGQLHGISQFESHTMEYENIIFSTDFLVSQPGDSLNTEFFKPFFSGTLSFSKIITPENEFYPAFSSCLNKIDNVRSTFEKGYKLAIKAYMFEFFYEIYRHSNEEAIEKTDKNIEKLKDVLKFIELNYKLPITVEEAAKICNFSPSHFMRFFKNTMGTSFVNYLNDYRLSMASRMLLSSQDTIINIASDCGYDNLSYFNRLFKRRFKMTPSGYRSRGV